MTTDERIVELEKRCERLEEAIKKLEAQVMFPLHIVSPPALTPATGTGDTLDLGAIDRAADLGLRSPDRYPLTPPIGHQSDAAP